MNKWIEIILAWFVGGFIGRLLGNYCLVDLLGWPSVCGWASIPIGSAIAWLAVDLRKVITATVHAYRYTPRPAIHFQPKVIWDTISKNLMEVKTYLANDWNKFRIGYGWKILNGIFTGLIFGSWILCLIKALTIFMSHGRPDTAIWSFIAMSAVFTAVSACFTLTLIALNCDLLKKMDLRKYFDTPRTSNPVRDEAIDTMLTFLALNPISTLIILLIATLYFTWQAISTVGVWLGKIAWKTIQMINSSQRMSALTGAAIGLTISQIYHYNPLICGGVCILAGLAEHLVFKLAEKAITKRQPQTW